MKAKKTWGFGSKSFQGTDAKIASCKKSRLANFASGSMHSSISMFRIFSYKKNLLQLEKKSGTLGFFVTRSLKGLNAGYSVYIESDDDAELIGMFSMLLLHEKIWTSTNSFCCRIPETRRPKYAIHFLSTTPLTQIYQSLFRVGRLLKKSRGKSI